MKLKTFSTVFVFALILSFIIHVMFFIGLEKLPQKKEEKEEEKPIYITLYTLDNKDTKSAPTRKIPKTSRNNLKSTKSFSSQTSAKNPPSTLSSQDISPKPLNNKINPGKKSPHPKISPKKPITKNKKAKVIKTLKKKSVKEKKTLKPQLKKTKKLPEKKIKKEAKSLPQKTLPFSHLSLTSKLSKNPDTQKKKKNKKSVKSSIPEKKPPLQSLPSKENTKPSKKIDLADIKGKDSIFQPGENKKTKTPQNPISNKEIQDYLYYVRDRLQENLAYPLMAKRLEIEGTVIVRFVIDKKGNVDEKSIKIVKSSGSNILDKQAIITVKNSIPFKPPPTKKNIIIEIPVVFEIIRSYE